MPNFDKTGPQGMGPGTGQGMGPCGVEMRRGGGRGRGLGQSFGRGQGRGYGRGFGSGCPFWPSGQNTPDQTQ